MQRVRDLIRHKLDVDGVTYTDSASLNHLTYKLNDLSTVDSSTSSVSIPTYDNGVSNVYSNFNKYYTFLKAVMSRSGFSTTRVQGESWGLTTLVNRIKFTPTLTLSSTPSTVDVGDTVTVTASLEINGTAMSGQSILFYDASDDTLLDTVVTDVNGEAEYEFTYSSPISIYCVFGETRDYINVSSRTKKIPSLIFSDDASIDRTSEYGSSVALRNRTATASITWNSNGYYEITGTTERESYIPITGAMSTGDFEAEFDFQHTTLTTANHNAGTGIFVFNDTRHWRRSYINSYVINFGYTNGGYSPSETNYDYRSDLNSGDYVEGDWVHVKVTAEGSVWTQTVTYNGNSFSSSFTMPNSDNSGQLGLDVMWAGQPRYIRNIRISHL